MLLEDIRFLVTQDEERRILTDVDLLVEDGRIDEIGEDLSAPGERIDCSGKAVMPGLVNSHTHAAMTVFRGVSDSKLLQGWLEEEILPREDRLEGEDIYFGTLMGIAEMFLTGTTCFNDMYLMEGEVARAVDHAGVRAVLSYGMTDEHGMREPLEEVERLITGYKDHDLIEPAVGPHAPYTCSTEFLRKAGETAEEHDVPLHIHLSETEEENERILEAEGKTPAEYLDSLGLLGPRTVAAHCTHLNGADIEILEERGAGVAHNPAANLKLGSGIAPVPGLEGVDVGLGTDGMASNNNHNLFEEMKFASLVQKLEDPREMSAQKVLDMATIDGARVLGLEDRIGSLEEGKRADILTVELSSPELSPVNKPEDLISHLVFSFSGNVSDTMVEGDLKVRDGELTELDIDEIRGEVEDRRGRIDGESA